MPFWKRTPYTANKTNKGRGLQALGLIFAVQKQRKRPETEVSDLWCAVQDSNL